MDGLPPFQRLMIKVRISLDGGDSRSSVVSIPHVHEMCTSADPSLSFDDSGRVYLSPIDDN